MSYYVFSLFYSHCNHEGNVIVIFLAMGTCKGDSFEGALFALTHLRVLCFTVNHFASYLFSSIVDNTHIIGSHFIVTSAHEHF
jgi:hypothetical protein